MKQIDERFVYSTSKSSELRILDCINNFKGILEIFEFDREKIYKTYSMVLDDLGLSDIMGEVEKLITAYLEVTDEELIYYKKESKEVVN